MRLSRLFAINTAILSTLVGVMLSWIIFDEWQIYRSARDGLGEIQTAYMAMVVAEKVSFERGPANGVLGDAQHDPAKLQRLKKARAASDTVIAELMARIADDTDLHDQEAAIEMHKAIAQLEAARREVDGVAALPRSRRSAEQVMGAVHQMFDVIPIIMSAVTKLSRDAEEIYPQFSDALIGARLAAELREQAGRLGSQFTAALTEQKPLADSEKQAIDVLRGRIEQLHMLIQLRLQSQFADQLALGAMQSMEQRYFGDGLRFVNGVIADSEAGRRYGMDAAGFAARYVPDMASIIQLRDVMVENAMTGARESHRVARQNLLLALFIGMLTVLTVLVILLVIRHRVVSPLLRTAKALAEIAHGKFDIVVPARKQLDEIGDILDVVALLKANSIAKQRLEVERQQLVDELRQASRTDFLTGILNRRAFSEVANAQIANARRHGTALTLIMFDIDHFKSINDRFGHDAGDAVLVEIADLARRVFREGDIVARYGGEEFIALACNCDLQGGMVLADRLRLSIENWRFTAADGTLRATSSFGLALFDASQDDLGSLLRRADQALYLAKQHGRNRVETS